MTATFPILDKDHQKLLPSVPWALVAPHERQALHNHDQTLKRLAERGGLSLCELAAVLEDRDWRRMTTGEAFARVREHLDRFEDQGRKMKTELTDRCPRCNSPSPERHPSVQWEGEVQICLDPFHVSTEKGRQVLLLAGDAGRKALEPRALSRLDGGGR